MSQEHHGSRRVGQVKEVTSLSNPIVKDIKALANKKDRDETKSFMAEGLKLVIDALELGFEIRTLVYAKNVKEKPQVVQCATKTVALTRCSPGAARPGAKSTMHELNAWLYGTKLKGQSARRALAGQTGHPRGA